jgi:hypothetical protein
LRAAAMLLGIVYHASLSFALGAGWMAQDVSQSKAAYLFQAFVHGFRMQLFMLVSGFFTAMLWRRKGLKALLWHRCRRVLFRCLLGLVTVVPAMIGAVVFASGHNSARKHAPALAEPASANLWAAIRQGDIAALEVHLKKTGSLTNQHPQLGVTPLAWAALVGRPEMAFGCVGMFRSLLTRENRVIRYLSDSSYWLYLAHLPLCIVGQALISQ